MKLPCVDSRSIGVTTMTILETKPPIFDNKIMCFQIYSVFSKQFTSEWPFQCPIASRHNLGATIRDVLTSPDSTSPALDPQKPASPTMADEIGRISPTTASLTFPLQPQLSQQPNANICYTAGVIAASTSANFAPPSPTPPNTNISGSFLQIRLQHCKLIVVNSSYFRMVPIRGTSICLYSVLFILIVLLIA